MRSEALFVWDIVDACDAIGRFMTGKRHEAFLQDDLLQSAVLNKLIIIGEAVAHLSPGVLSSHPGIPWADVKGMRNAVIHGYYKVDLETIWETATSDVPKLNRACQQILKEKFPGFEPEHD